MSVTDSTKRIIDYNSNPALENDFISDIYEYPTFESFYYPLELDFKPFSGISFHELTNGRMEVTILQNGQHVTLDETKYTPLEINFEIYDGFRVRFIGISNTNPEIRYAETVSGIRLIYDNFIFNIALRSGLRLFPEYISNPDANFITYKTGKNLNTICNVYENSVIELFITKKLLSEYSAVYYDVVVTFTNNTNQTLLTVTNKLIKDSYSFQITKYVKEIRIYYHTNNIENLIEFSHVVPFSVLQIPYFHVNRRGRKHISPKILAMKHEIEWLFAKENSKVQYEKSTPNWYSNMIKNKAKMMRNYLESVNNGNWEKGLARTITQKHMIEAHKAKLDNMDSLSSYTLKKVSNSIRQKQQITDTLDELVIELHRYLNNQLAPQISVTNQTAKQIISQLYAKHISTLNSQPNNTEIIKIIKNRFNEVLQ